MHDAIIQQLKSNKGVFESLLTDCSPKLITYKPSDTAWSLLQIICHLVDEEREDFRQRVDYTLHQPGILPPSIDPEGWVTSRGYQEQSFKSKIAAFLAEREKSIQFLENLDEPKWDNYYVHPQLGNLTASHFLTNWLAHDFIHIRQINRNKYLYLRANTTNDCSYAGTWR